MAKTTDRFPTSSVWATSCSPDLAAASIRRHPEYLEAKAKLARGEALPAMDGHTKRALVMSLKRLGLTRDQARTACAYTQSQGALHYSETLPHALLWARTQRKAA